MTMRVNVDVVPTAVRPAQIEEAIAAAMQMRERARQADEALAAAQRTVEEREREDVEAAAAKARAGQPLGSPNRALVKARDDIMSAQRTSNAFRLAREQCEQQVAETIVAARRRLAAGASGCERRSSCARDQGGRDVRSSRAGDQRGGSRDGMARFGSIRRTSRSPGSERAQETPSLVPLLTGDRCCRKERPGRGWAASYASVSSRNRKAGK